MTRPQPGQASLPEGRTLVLGGARSGKSAYAESLLRPFPRVRYVATGYPPGGDAEWAERVRRHQEQRPAVWQTIETTDLPPVLADPVSPVLVDCFSVWLTRRMDSHDCWQAGQTPPALLTELDQVVEAWRTCQAACVGVSNEVGMGVIPATWSGRAFRDLLGTLNRGLAAVSDTVVLMIAGLPMRVK